MSGGRYYADKLSARRLRRVYEIAPPRVRRYLEAEIGHVMGRIGRGGAVLELGCGYGRVLERLLAAAGVAVGIDTSFSSLLLARETYGASRGFHLAQMDAAALGFANRVFDAVVCIQNGISAFGVDRRRLVRESLRVARPGGRVLFSSYSDRFWNDRLEWFELQAAQGLLGEIDREATGDGVIACKDGFRATTVGPDEFAALAGELELEADIVEVDGSSVFCEIEIR